MPGLWSRIKIWAFNETVTSADINAEFDNVITNQVPDQFDDFSVNVTQMQQAIDPGEVGSESLATNLAEELKRIRFTLKELKGTDQWYESADSTIEELANAVGGGTPKNRITSGRTRTTSEQPIFLVPNGTTNTVTVKGASVNLVYFVDGSSTTISTDVSATSLLLAPSTGNTATVDDSTLVDEERTKLIGEYGTSLFMTSAGSQITARLGEIAAFKVNNGVDDDFFVARIKSATELVDVRRGYFFDSSDAPLERFAIADGDTITLLQLTWIFATNTGTLLVTNNNVRASKDEPVSPNTGDFWFDLKNEKWKQFNSTVFADANATFIGVCAQDTTATVAARSTDFFRAFDEFNTILLERFAVDEVRSTLPDQEINIYGKRFRFTEDKPRWVMPTDLDTGVSETADTVYYLYITEEGDTVISDIAPYDRTQDLFGRYHPHHPWRALGEINNDSSSDFSVAARDYSVPDTESFSVNVTTSANAMTAKFLDKNLDEPTITTPIILDFRSSGSNGDPEFETINHPMQLTVPAGATLGHNASAAEPVYWYALNETGAAPGAQVVLGVSKSFLNEEEIQASFAISAGSDDNKFYTAVSSAGRAIRLLAKVTSNEATPGNWTGVKDTVLRPFHTDAVLRTTTSSGSFTTTSTSYVTITNQSLVHHCSTDLCFVSLFSTNEAGGWADGAAAQTFCRIQRNGTTIWAGIIDVNTGNRIDIPYQLMLPDKPGKTTTNTYVVQLRSSNGETVTADHLQMNVFEIPGVVP